MLRFRIRQLPLFIRHMIEAYLHRRRFKDMMKFYQHNVSPRFLRLSAGSHREDFWELRTAFIPIYTAFMQHLFFNGNIDPEQLSYIDDPIELCYQHGHIEPLTYILIKYQPENLLWAARNRANFTDLILDHII